MKIVQLSTSDMGGAGIAAKQLHLQLLKNQVESKFITKVKLGNDIAGHEVIAEDQKQGLIKAVIKRVGNTIKYRVPFLDNDLNYYLRNRDRSFEYFSFPFSDNDISSRQDIVNSDIIHLHWIADKFIDYKNVFSLSDKKF